MHTQRVEIEVTLALSPASRTWHASWSELGVVMRSVDLQVSSLTKAQNAVAQAARGLHAGVGFWRQTRLSTPESWAVTIDSDPFESLT